MEVLSAVYYSITVAVERLEPAFSGGYIAGTGSESVFLAGTGSRC